MTNAVDDRHRARHLATATAIDASARRARGAMESLARAVMTSIPPNAIDRQRVCEVIGRAEGARASGRHRDAAKMLIDV